MPNILYLLHFHLNHPSNTHLLPLLLPLLNSHTKLRLLKLLSTGLFN